MNINMNIRKNNKKYYFIILLLLTTSLVIGMQLVGNNQNVTADDLRLDDEEATIRSIKAVSPAVVNIKVFDQANVVSLELNGEEQTIEQERMEKGNGTGFIISSDGLIITNRHVVEAGDEETAEYKVVLESGKEYFAQLIGKDPLKDLAVLKIFDKDLPHVTIGNSDELSIGSTVIAIGNSLGKYPHSATKGIVSGLGRFINTFDTQGQPLKLDNVIQTDAEINLGNSGGPLVNLKGEVVGVSVAVDEGGTAIGFAIAINDVEPVIRAMLTVGRIVRPRIGVRYMMLTEEIAMQNELPRNSGAWLDSAGDAVDIILPDSPADKAGLEPGDIIFEINAIRIEGDNNLQIVTQKFKPGDKIGLKIQRGDKVVIIELVLDEFK